VESELRTCANLAYANARFQCYESLGKRVLANDAADTKTMPAPTEAAAPVVAAAPAAAAPAVEGALEQSPPPLPDDLGGGQFTNGNEAPANQYSGLVTKCQKGSDGFWYFRFENGQVWKYINVVKGQFADCNFRATISEERMGHKMQIDGDDSKLRVTRIR
jgi:hypothetical protein